MVFALTDRSREALENYKELWSEIKDQIQLISGYKPIEYKKDFMKIKFESDDDFPLSKILNIPVCIIIVRSVFPENNIIHKYFYMSVFMNINVT